MVDDIFKIRRELIVIVVLGIVQSGESSSVVAKNGVAELLTSMSGRQGSVALTNIIGQNIQD